MLNDFIRAEVEDYCECQEIELTENQLKRVISIVANDDEWYDIMTSNIQSAVCRVKGKV